MRERVLKWQAVKMMLLRGFVKRFVDIYTAGSERLVVFRPRDKGANAAEAFAPTTSGNGPFQSALAVELKCPPPPPPRGDC